MTEDRRFENLQRAADGSVMAARVDIGFVDPDGVPGSKSLWYDSETLEEAAESARMEYGSLATLGYTQIDIRPVGWERITPND